jgi:hypothetical protein
MRFIIQFLLKSSCVMCVAGACLILFVAFLAFFFDSSLPGTSLISNGMGGHFKQLLLLSVGFLAAGIFIYNKLPPFNDIFTGK